MNTKVKPFIWLIPIALIVLLVLWVPSLMSSGARPQLGEAMQDFWLTDSLGERFQLSEAYARGPVILIFYRGYFCGICQNQLQELETWRPQFEALGAQMVAISTDSRDYAERARVNLGLGYRVLSDDKLKLLKMLDHKESYGDGSNIHNPAIYIVDQEGIIRYAYFGTDAADRPEPENVYAALTAIVEATASAGSA